MNIVVFTLNLENTYFLKLFNIKLELKEERTNKNIKYPTFFYCFSSLLRSCLQRMNCYKLSGLYEDKKGGTTICLWWKRAIIRQCILNFSIKHMNLVLKGILCEERILIWQGYMSEKNFINNFLIFEITKYLQIQSAGNHIIAPLPLVVLSPQEQKTTTKRPP